MILLFDVGNTNIFIGLADGEKIVSTYRINTEPDKTADEYYVQLKPMIAFDKVKGVAISSVVPRVTEALREIASRILKLTPLIVGPGVKTGIHIKTDHPREVGADLICDAAGIENNDPITMVIDLGTAIKYIYVKEQTIRGVIIAPGIDISIKALTGHTALLPDIDIEVPKNVLGTNTIHCMQSGVTYGVASQIDGLVERVKKETKETFQVILTGGLAPMIAPLCETPLRVDTELVLKGLLKIYHKN